MSNLNFVLFIFALAIVLSVLSWAAPAAYAVVELTFFIVAVFGWAFYELRAYRLRKLVQNV